MYRTFFQIIVIAIFLLILFPGAGSLVTAQTPDPAKTPAVSSEADKDGTKEEKTARIKSYREGFKVVVDGAQTLIGWCLIIIGGSIATILSTSYLRPAQLWMRSSYLLFLPGWTLISMSMYFGHIISRNYMAAAQVIDTTTLYNIGKEINSNFGWQLFYFQAGLVIFGLWLFLFLLWWVFGNWSVAKNP